MKKKITAVVIARKNSGFDDLIDNKSNGFLFNSKKKRIYKITNQCIKFNKIS